MGQYIIDGKIGAGKTYYCLNYVLRKYYVWDDLLEEYVPKKNIVFISNIDGLKIDHIDLSKKIEEIGLENVFNDDFIDKVRNEYRCVHIIFIIDEVQKLFDRKFYNKKIFNFFQLQRHSGADFFMITQDVYSVAREISTLAEYTIHALSRSTGSGLSFSYKKIINEEVVKRIVIKRDKRVFKFYKSFNFDELEKPKPVYLRFAAIGIGLFVAAAILFKFLFAGVLLGQAQNSITPYAKAHKKTDQVFQKNSGGNPNVINYKDLIALSPHDKLPSPVISSVEQSKLERVAPVRDDASCKLYFSVTNEDGKKIEKYKCDGYNIQSVDGVKTTLSANRNSSEGIRKLSSERMPGSEANQERRSGRS